MQLPTLKGRGTPMQPGNRYERTVHEVDLGALEEVGELPCGQVATTVIADQSRSIINRVDPAASPDIAFRWTLNPYRGCSHGCPNSPNIPRNMDRRAAVESGVVSSR